MFKKLSAAFMFVGIFSVAHAQVPLTATITSLPHATVPLSGTEAVPLVQNGTTKQAPASAFGGGSTLNLSAAAGIILSPNPLTSSGTIGIDTTRVFTSSASGLVPASGGGTNNFLRADGNWASLAGGGTVTSITAGTGLTGGTITGAGTVAIDTSILPQLGVSSNTFAGYVTAANGFGVNCTPSTSNVQNCFFHGTYGSPVSGGGVGLQGFQFDSANGSVSHYGASIFEDFMPTSQPGTLQYLSPDGVLATIWSDPTVSFCVTGGGAGCSANWNIALLSGVFGQGYMWPNSTGNGLITDWMAGVVGAAQLGNGATTGEGTLNNAVAVAADLLDSDYDGDNSTKGQIKNAIGLDITGNPCASYGGRSMGASAGTCYGILFDSYYNDPLHAATGLTAPNGGSIAAIGGQAITIKTDSATTQIYQAGTKTAEFSNTVGPSILGTTNGTHAPSGDVGETIECDFSTGGLSSGSPSGFTGACSLTAGVWQVIMQSYFTAHSGTLSSAQCWVGTTNASTSGIYFGIVQTQSFTASSDQEFACGTKVIVLTSTSNIYGNGQVTYSGGSGVTALGYVQAIRLH